MPNRRRCPRASAGGIAVRAPHRGVVRSEIRLRRGFAPDRTPGNRNGARSANESWGKVRRFRATMPCTPRTVFQPALPWKAWRARRAAMTVTEGREWVGAILGGAHAPVRDGGRPRPWGARRRVWRFRATMPCTPRTVFEPVLPVTALRSRRAAMTVTVVGVCRRDLGVSPCTCTRWRWRVGLWGPRRGLAFSRNDAMHPENRLANRAVHARGEWPARRQTMAVMASWWPGWRPRIHARSPCTCRVGATEGVDGPPARAMTGWDGGRWPARAPANTQPCQRGATAWLGAFWAGADAPVRDGRLGLGWRGVVRRFRATRPCTPRTVFQPASSAAAGRHAGRP